MAMLDKDNLTYRKRVVGNAAAMQAERTLITQERSQKLDLLIHLLANLRQALVICGPEGIGKTTMLQILQEKRQDQWQICLLQGSSALSFETIINNLSRFLSLGGSSRGFDLSSLRAYCEKQKVVLIIDDAGELVPGLIGELVDFVDSLSGLRLVFSMTYDEFHIKAGSDKAIDDCHFIELPPLNPKQCGEYLQNLSAQPGAMLSFKAVTDSLVENLYRETHGIPGKILAEIPKLNQYQSRKPSRLGLWVGVAAIVLAAGWAVKALLPGASTTETQNATRSETAAPAAVQKPTTPETVGSQTVAPNLPAPVPSRPSEQDSPQIELARPGFLETPAPKPAPPEPQVSAKAPEAAAGAAPKPASPGVSSTSPTVQAPPPAVAKPEASATSPAAKTPQPPVTKTEAPTTAPSPAGEEATAPNPAKPEPPASSPAAQASQPPAAKTEAPASLNGKVETKPAEAPATAATTTPEQKPAKPVSDIDWIMAQPPGNYSVQLMMLSSKDAVNRFLKKNAEYRDDLKYYPIRQFDQERYVLIYGSFQSAGDALKRKATMPEEFRNGIERRFKSIQQQIRR
ncbi:MAG: AAA family ATPase [Methylomonas sp.]